MRIQAISIHGLFDVFDYHIPLNLKDRITIIHGPNGSGKTIILSLLHGLFNGNYSKIRSIPFSEFKIQFDDNSSLVISKNYYSESEPQTPLLIYSRSGAETKTHLLTDIRRQDLSFPLSAIDDLIPNLSRVGSDTWRALDSDEMLSLSQVIEKFGDKLPLKHKDPKWLIDIKEKISVNFITTERLRMRFVERDIRRERYLREPLESTSSAVEVYSKDLSKRIQNTLAEYAQKSQPLDRTFPSRLVKEINATQTPTITADELRDRLKELEDKSARLVAAGLLEKADNVSVPIEINDLTHNVLAIYVSDVEQKLAVFDTMLDKLETLKKIIGKRFLLKKVVIGEKGFSFETITGKMLSPGDLSSGEQHELVLFYRLLFELPSSSLILIDEPEISLHIAWQQEFIEDLQEITRFADTDVLIATHAPDIIHDKWGWTVDLGDAHTGEGAK